MTATDAMIAEVRRMVAEPTTDPYNDTLISGIIERYPRIDEQGELPYTLSSDSPPEQDANDEWIVTYDLHAAAADIWEEKAAGVVHLYNMSADGGKYDRSNMYEQYMKLCRSHRAQRLPGTVTLHKSPKEVDPALWIANLPEPD